MTSSVWVGLDLGTSGIKAVAMDAHGQVLARGQASYPTARPMPGASEQDPGDWLTATADSLRVLATQVPAVRWRGIGLSGMIPTLVTLDRHDQPTGPAITWEDGRADTYGEWLREAAGADALSSATGQWLDGRYLLPMTLGLLKREPGRVVQTIAGAKDYLFRWLTGELATDPSTASGVGAYVVADGSWDASCLAAFTAQADLPELPRVLPSTTVLPLAATAATQLGIPAGLPICLGAADSVLGARGLGVQEPGQVAYLAGTSTVILGLSSAWIPAPHHRYLLTPTTAADSFGVEMDLLCTGSAIRWLAGLLRAESEQALMDLSAEVRAEDAPPFLGYLAPGEQGALWDPSLTGTVSGLHLGHTPGHLARGLLNGILLESRRCIDALRDAGLPSRDVRVAGGSATDRGFRQDLADCTGATVVAPDGHTDQSALGAAMLTAQAVSACLPRRDPAVGHSIAEPRADRRPVWEGLWERHEQLRRQITRSDVTRAS